MSDRDGPTIEVESAPPATDLWSVADSIAVVVKTWSEVMKQAAGFARVHLRPLFRWFRLHEHRRHQDARRVAAKAGRRERSGTVLHGAGKGYEVIG